MRRSAVSLLGLLATLAACSSQEPPPPANAPAAQPLPNSNIFQSDLRALDKAKGVQQTIDRQRPERDAKLDDDGG
jgi:hypothetical protein